MVRAGILAGAVADPTSALLGAADGTVALQSEVLPEGTALPPLPYLAVLALGLVAVGAVLWRLEPPITDETVPAFAAWMVLGGLLHGVHQVVSLPSAIEPLLGTPSVYATTALLAGAVWIGALQAEDAIGRSPDRILGGVGALAVLALAGAALVDGVQRGSVDPVPAALSVVVTALVVAGAWAGLRLQYTASTRVAGATGVVVLAAHALDGVSTAIGYDLLDASERSPVSERILEAGASLPIADLVGAGWLFVAVKIAVAAAVVVLFREWLREEPREARLTLALVAAVGLGPAANNLAVFTLAPA